LCYVIVLLESLGFSRSCSIIYHVEKFDGHAFKAHGIIVSFIVMLGGKTISIEVKVVDVPLNYNILLGHS